MRLTGAIALLALGALAVASCTGGGSPPPSSSPPPTQVVTSASPPAFSFSSVKIAPAPVVAGRGVTAAQKAGRTIEGALGGFYQSGFADPSLWGVDLPVDAWSSFSSGIRSRAERDAASLTLGKLGVGIERLTFTRKDLLVRILLDQSGRPQAALATVTVQANAERAEGGTIQVSNHATFLLEPSGNAWVIQGYPAAKTSGAPPS